MRCSKCLRVKRKPTTSMKSSRICRECKSNRVCVFCHKEYSFGFWGSGHKYCSKHCSKKALLTYKKHWYDTHRKQVSKKCWLCKRNILSIKKTNYIGKYCSKRCMIVANRIRRSGKKTVNIRIPVKTIVVKKVFKLPVEFIPFLFGDKKW